MVQNTIHYQMFANVVLVQLGIQNKENVFVEVLLNGISNQKLVCALVEPNGI